MKIKNIVFDLGGVLLDLDWRACVSEFAKNGIPQVEQILSPHLTSGIFMQLEIGKISKAEFYNGVRAKSQSDISDETIDYCISKFAAKLPIYKLEMLRKLRESYNVYMLSNTSSITLDYVDSHMFTQEGLTWESYFDRRYVSFEMQQLKPDSEIYLSMLEDGEIKPEETLFLDDNLANITAAKKLGLQTYLVTPPEDYREYIYSL